jgi:hypothetical protein
MSIAFGIVTVAVLALVLVPRLFRKPVSSRKNRHLNIGIANELTPISGYMLGKKRREHDV